MADVNLVDYRPAWPGQFAVAARHAADRAAYTAAKAPFIRHVLAGA